MQDFKHKLAVITGGASGVGRSLAFAIGREGGRVLIADTDADNEKLQVALKEWVTVAIEVETLTVCDSGPLSIVVVMLQLARGSSLST